MEKTMQKSRRYSGAFEFGFRNSDFGFQSIDKERWCKWPVAEYFAKHLLNRAEELNSQNVSKPRARIADCFPTSITLSGAEELYLYFGFGIQDATKRVGEMDTRGNSRGSSSSLNVVTVSGVEMLYLYFGFGIQDATKKEGEMDTRGNSRVLSSSLNVVTVSGVEVHYLYFGFGFQDVTRREGEMETRENSRNSLSSLNVVTLSGVEVCYSKAKGSGNDLASAGQIAETRRNANHFQVSDSDRRSISTLSFVPKLRDFTLSLSSFRMHGKTNRNERMPIKRVFTN